MSALDYLPAGFLERLPPGTVEKASHLPDDLQQVYVYLILSELGWKRDQIDALFVADVYIFARARSLLSDLVDELVKGHSPLVWGTFVITMVRMLEDRAAEIIPSEAGAFEGMIQLIIQDLADRLEVH